jgi:signal peptidase I
MNAEAWSSAATSDPKPSPRRPWLAALMSLVLPGFGQLYNGDVNRAIWLFLWFALLCIPGVALAALYLPAAWTIPLLALGFLEALGTWIYSVWNAWRVAKRSAAFKLQAWQLSGVYVLVLVVCGLVALPLLTMYVRTNQVEPFKIPSNSMAPTLLPGDFLFADKRYNCPQCKHAVRRDDVAIFVYPNDRTMYFVKRIVALPGDRVELKNQQVFVNGTALPQRALSASNSAPNSPLTTASEPALAQDFVVAPGSVFVLGDNHASSKDSRQFGTVPLQDVVGHVRQIWFSWGDDGVRWSRLGLTPR